MATRLNDGGSALYFYGVSRGRTRALQSLRGIDAIGMVENCECSGLTCWFSRVDGGEYGERLAQNMENIEWLANASVQHQRVVGSIAEAASILPARFGTVFLGEKSMTADVNARKAALTAALKRIDGAAEWGVKVFAEAAPVPAARPATSGTDYLKQKSEQIRSRAIPGAPPELKKMNEDMAKAAVASVVVRGKTPQPGLLWQASFLVKRTAEKAFHEVLRRYAAKLASARIETSGPWPPYSFAGVAEEKPGPEERKTVRSTKKAAGGTPAPHKTKKTRAKRPRR